MGGMLAKSFRGRGRGDSVCQGAGPRRSIGAEMKVLVRYWLPLLAWMALIYTASGDAQSTARTSRFLEPFLRWIRPDITPEAVESVRWGVRKLAHMTEYAVLAGLWWRALRQGRSQERSGWSWPTAGIALLLCALYAATDEWHQTFVPNRTGSPVDVAIDTFGAAVGLALIQAWTKVRQRHTP